MSVAEAEDHLRSLLEECNSQYRYTLAFLFQSKRVVKFKTEWSRRPTPHEPLPDIRVEIVFALRYDGKDHQKKNPELTYRIGHENFVHTTLENIDHHILRNIKFKTCTFAANPLKLEQSATYKSRTAYKPLEIDSSSIANFPGIEEVSKEEGQQSVEAKLIEVFQKTDIDNNGVLDPREFENLLLDADLGFTKTDIKAIMKAHDLNQDGLLVYGEFIPVAIDLYQTQLARVHSEDVVLKRAEEAYTEALNRIQSSKGLHRAMDLQLSSLDREQEGTIALANIKQFLQTLDLELTANEIEYVLRILRRTSVDHDTDDDGGDGEIRIIYKEFQSVYENLFLEALQQCTLDSQSTKVELYLLSLLQKKDLENTGLLHPSIIAAVLAHSEQIELSDIQVYAIIGANSDEVINYRAFVRKAAVMVYKLFDVASLEEKKALVSRAKITPISLLGPRSNKRVKQQLVAKFDDFDADSDGFLNETEFHQCIADTGLCLSHAKVEKLRKDSDLNGDDLIDLAEFLEFGNKHLLTLARNAALKGEYVNVAMRQRESERVRELAEAKEQIQQARKLRKESTRVM